MKRSGARVFACARIAQRLIVGGALVANGRREPANGFEIVREHVGPRIHHDVERREIAAIVAAEDLDLAIRHALVDRANRVCEDQRAAVGEIVAVDGGQHEILPAEVAHRFGDANRFEPIDFAPGFPVFTLQKRQPRVHVSPRIMIVAVPAPQHSAMFGQAASLQTVLSASVLTLARTRS